MHIHAHNHDHGQDATGRRRGAERRGLRIALVLTALILVAEVVGGCLSNSLALLADAGPGTEAVVDARRRGAAAARALGELPEKQRAALCLAAVEGLSYAEVAEALDVTEKAVKSLVHRARSSLARRLAGEEG